MIKNDKTIVVLLNKPITEDQKLWVIKNKGWCEVTDDVEDLRYLFYDDVRIVKFTNTEIKITKLEPNINIAGSLSKLLDEIETNS